MFRDLPIKRKLTAAMLLICGTVLCITCITFFTYEYITVKNGSQKQLSIIARIIVTNSTAALAFEDREAAQEILLSLKAQPRISFACFYDDRGHLIVKYPANAADSLFPKHPGVAGYSFYNSYLDGFEPVREGDKKLGTLYIRSDLKAFHDRMRVLGFVSIGLLIISLIVAWILSGRFQRNLSGPILALVNTSKSVSFNRDYTIRARKYGNDELGALTDEFNNMLSQIESQNAEITSFNQQLEQKVEVRTTELEHANHELESFTYSVSHDLRAPLRKINSFINMFMDRFKGPLPDEDRILLDRIVANSNKMGKLIDDLLAFSRVSKLYLDKKVVSMNQIVKNLSDEFVRQDGRRNIQFIMHHLPDITADPAAITQVWENLISNALKYSSNRDQVRIELGAETLEHEIVYCIKDNGSGFDMRHYGKLFTAFERLHSSSEFEGTGVGLAIVQRIIEKHGGRIWAESEVDAGATFFFSLPRSASSAGRERASIFTAITAINIGSGNP